MDLKGLGRRAYNIYLDTHTVAGITISAALFVIFYAGAFSLFREEISQWENPTTRGVEPQELKIEQTLAAVRVAEPKFAEEKFITIRSGHESAPMGMVYGQKWVTDSTTEFFSAMVNPADGYTVRMQDDPLTTVGSTLYGLHYFRQLPLGIFIAGFVALFFLFATITGVMIHWQNIISKFYAFTTKPSWKSIWKNAHTVLGMVGLPFQVIYAVTGAFYGILTLLIIPAALVFFGGDNQKVAAAVLPSQGIELSDSSAVVTHTGVDELIAMAQARYPEVPIRTVRFQNFGKEDGIVRLFFDDESTISGQGEIVYRLETKALLFDSPPHQRDYASTVFGVIGRLHFATYGGIGLKVIYFILAMLTCFMLIAGILLWQAARDKKQYTEKQRRFQHRVTKVNLAVCLGLFPAVAVIFMANKLIPLDLAERTFYVDAAFFGSWALFIVMGLFWNNYRRLNGNFLLMGGMFSLLLPVINGLMTGDWLWTSLSEGMYYVAGVDIFWIITGLCALGGWNAARRFKDGDNNLRRPTVITEAEEKVSTVIQEVGKAVEPSLNLKTPPPAAS